MHPEEDYFRLNLWNDDLPDKENIKNFREEREYLLQCEIEEYSKE